MMFLLIIQSHLQHVVFCPTIEYCICVGILPQVSLMVLCILILLNSEGTLLQLTCYQYHSVFVGTCIT